LSHFLLSDEFQPRLDNKHPESMNVSGAGNQLIVLPYNVTTNNGYVYAEFTRALKCVAWPSCKCYSNDFHFYSH